VTSFEVRPRPTAPIQELRDLTRTRKQLVRDTSQHTLRIQKTLEDANLKLSSGNKATRRAYKTALADFMAFTAIVQPEEFRIVTRAHVIAWRDNLERRDMSLRSHPSSNTCVRRTP
jgi:hypothetical protein